MLTSLISSAVLAMSSQVYIAKFNDSNTELKAKISLHHALLKSSAQGMYFDLTQAEANLLRDNGALLIQANSKWQSEYANLQKRQTNTTNLNGIPGYPCYDTVEGTLDQAKLLSETYPELTEFIDIGDSWQKQQLGSGYDLMVLKIGNKELVDPPILFMQSGLHAREYATVGLTTAFAQYLLENKDSDPDINWILNRHQIHILLQANPDGRKIAENGVYQRKNHNENHCAGGTVGVDLNRNFSSTWGTVSSGSSGESCSQVFRGNSAGSEPEVQAIEAYVRSIYPDNRADNKEAAAPSDTKGLFLDIHSYSELILWPWGDLDIPAPNQKGLEALGRKLAYFNSYKPMQSVGLYPTDGTSDALAYDELGVAHITFELGTEFFQSCSVFENTIKPKNIDALLYAAKVVEKPYEMTRGPDITNFTIQESNDSQVTFKATATERNFSKFEGSIPTEKIALVNYSVNEYLSDENAQMADFKDGVNDSDQEDVEIRLNKSLFLSDDVTVYLQAKDAGGFVGPVSAFKIQNSLPELKAEVICNGAKCNFNGLNNEQGILPNWFVSDSQTSNEKSAQFIMPSLGNYTAQYTLTNLLGKSITKSIDFSVTELHEPVANFSYVCDKLSCSFNAESSSDLDSKTLAYEWRLSDTDVKNEIKIEHIFANEGTFSVVLNVKDEHEQVGTITKSITVSNGETPTVEEKEPAKSGGSLSYMFLVLLALGSIRLKLNYCR